MTRACYHRTLLAVALFTLAAVAWLPAACDQSHTTDKLVGAEADDPRLAAATAEARRRWGEFTAAFRGDKAGADYLVKAPFSGKGGEVEHMWAGVTAIDGDSMTGILLSDPYAEFDIKQGDQVTINASEIEDWSIQKADGTSLGEFHTPVLKQIESEASGK